jgi:hypothetical protein
MIEIRTFPIQLKTSGTGEKLTKVNIQNLTKPNNQNLEVDSKLLTNVDIQNLVKVGQKLSFSDIKKVSQKLPPKTTISWQKMAVTSK